jgi:hypothetical protein
MVSKTTCKPSYSYYMCTADHPQSITPEALQEGQGIGMDLSDIINTRSILTKYANNSCDWTLDKAIDTLQSLFGDKYGEYMFNAALDHITEALQDDTMPNIDSVIATHQLPYFPTPKGASEGSHQAGIPKNLHLILVDSRSPSPSDVEMLSPDPFVVSHSKHLYTCCSLVYHSIELLIPIPTRR